MLIKRFIGLVLSLFLATPCFASYDFSPGTSRLFGTFTTQHGVALTLGCFFKYTVHPQASQVLVSLSNTTNENPSIVIESTGTDEEFGARAFTSASNAAVYAGTAAQWDGEWTALIGEFSATNARDVFVDVPGNTGSDANARNVGTALDTIVVGMLADFSSRQWATLIAEVAIWSGTLTTQEKTDYMAGTKPASAINASELIGYWPLSASADPQLNLGTDAAGDLAVTNATFNADHPTITSGATAVPRRRRLK